MTFVDRICLRSSLAALALCAASVVASVAAAEPAAAGTAGKAEKPARVHSGDLAAGPVEQAADGALLVAGLPLPEASPLRRYAKGAAYRGYARRMDQLWKMVEARTLSPIRGWVATHLAGSMPETVFYPFAGPDLLNAVTFFPQARTYILYGLEKVGRLPGDLAGTSPDEFAEGMGQLRDALNHIAGLNFFRTVSMKAEVGSSEHNGVGAMIGVFLARTGHTVVGARYIKLDEAGVPQTISGRRWVKAVEVSFRAPGDGDDVIRRVYYFRGDISDQAWSKNVGMQAFIARQGPMVTFLKAASYLMWEPLFDDIRATVLARSMVIVEESSGVPYHFLTAGPWDLTLYGSYNGPIPPELFPGKCQPDLRAAIATESRGALPFSYGYQHRKSKSHLILARRKAGVAVEVAQFDGSTSRGVRTHCDENWKQSVNRR